MVKLYKNFNISKNHKESIILIGNFDGVHLGHQKLFKLAKSYKKKHGLKIGVINFNPMPKMFFNKSLKNFRLSSIDQKVNLINNLGVDFIVTKKFDKTFSKTKSINFIKNILSNKSVNNYIENLYKEIKVSAVKNFEKWEILGQDIWPNKYNFKSHKEEVNYLQDWIIKRLNYLDSKWN